MTSDENKEPLALGIDPGLSGAIVLVSARRIHFYLDLNECRADKKTAGRTNMVDGSYLDPSAILRYLIRMSPLGRTLDKPRKILPMKTPDIIVMEDVSTQRAGDDATSMFKFGQTKGLLTGIIHTLFYDHACDDTGVPIRYLKPAVWKGALGLNRDKRRSLSLARKFWPSDAKLFSRLMDNDRAEAALLAHCGLRFLER